MFHNILTFSGLQKYGFSEIHEDVFEKNYVYDCDKSIKNILIIFLLLVGNIFYFQSFILLPSISPWFIFVVEFNN